MARTPFMRWLVRLAADHAEAERHRLDLFATDHCSVEFQGYMEGSAAEGIRAAKEILTGLHWKQ